MTIAAVVVFSWAAVGHAQRFPSKELTIVCGSKPGAPIVVFARAMATKLEKFLGKLCVAQNRTGGTQAESLSLLLSKSADGHTMATAGPTTVSVLASTLGVQIFPPLPPFTFMISFSF